MVLLKSNDGFTIEVDDVAAFQSEVVRKALEESNPRHVTTLHNVSGEVLTKIVDYLTKQAEFISKKPQEDVGKVSELAAELHGPEAEAADALAEMSASRKLKAWENEVKKWEQNYINVDMNMLYDLYLAANYMDIQGLLYLCADKIASFIRGKTSKEIRKFFNIRNDFTKNTEEAFWAQYGWAFTED